MILTYVLKCLFCIFNIYFQSAKYLGQVIIKSTNGNLSALSTRRPSVESSFSTNTTPTTEAKREPKQGTINDPVKFA